MTLLKLFQHLFLDSDDRKNYYHFLNYINMIMATRRRQVVAKTAKYKFIESHSVDDDSFGYINIYADVETLKISLVLLNIQPNTDPITNQIIEIEELGCCQINACSGERTFLAIKTV